MDILMGWATILVRIRYVRLVMDRVGGKKEETKMKVIERSVELLGKTAKDKITGSKGVVTSVNFDLFGCIQVILNPGKVGSDGKEIPCIGWIDVNRIEILKEKRVMDHPDFDVKYAKTEHVHGPANKPL